MTKPFFPPIKDYQAKVQQIWGNQWLTNNGELYKGQSIFNYGDVSTCSFHATKLFYTGEGGALFCQNEETYHDMLYQHNFGHSSPEEYLGLGINAKMCELEAAMGLSVLPHMEYIITERKRVCNQYDHILDFSKISKLKLRKDTEWNYSYYPVIFESETTLLKVQKTLNDAKVFPRRYLYPSFNTISFAKGAAMPISESIASRILCLPLYVELTNDEIDSICKVISNT